MSDILLSSKARAAQSSTAIRLSDTLAYDMVARVPLVLWFVLCGAAMVRHLAEGLHATHESSAALVLEMLARLAGLGFIVFVIVALVSRLRPIARSAGVLPRLVAIGGAFSITALALFPRTDMSSITATISLIMVLVGNGLACYALAHLGKSLSVMAEARRLVTSGPYRFVRHPLYAAEAVASLGLLLQFLSLPATLLWMVHIALQCCRMRYEEQILCHAFPGYAGYAARVARLIPGVY